MLKVIESKELKALSPNVRGIIRRAAVGWADAEGNHIDADPYMIIQSLNTPEQFGINPEFHAEDIKLAIEELRDYAVYQEFMNFRRVLGFKAYSMVDDIKYYVFERINEITE